MKKEEFRTVKILDALEFTGTVSECKEIIQTFVMVSSLLSQKETSEKLMEILENSANPIKSKA